MITSPNLVESLVLVVRFTLRLVVHSLMENTYSMMDLLLCMSKS